MGKDKPIAGTLRWLNGQSVWIDDENGKRQGYTIPMKATVRLNGQLSKLSKLVPNKDHVELHGDPINEVLATSEDN